MVDYTPATDIQIASYTMIANGTAYDTTPVAYATSLQEITQALTAIAQILPGVDASVVSSLQSASTQHGALVSHLNDHYSNLVDNLSIVTSAISDAIGYSVIGSPGAPSGSLTDPTASIPDYFGSIMGQSNLYVAQSANQLLGVAAQSAALLSGGVLSSILAATGISTACTTALGTLATPSVLVSTLSNITSDNITLLSNVMNALAVLPGVSDLGSLGVQIQSLENISQLGQALALINTLTLLGNLASDANIDDLGTNLAILTAAVVAILCAVTGTINSDIVALTTLVTNHISGASS